MLGGDTLGLSPAVLGGHQKDLSGLIADAEERSGVLLSGGKKKLPLSKQTALGTNNSVKYKLEMAPIGQYGAGTTTHAHRVDV